MSCPVEFLKSEVQPLLFCGPLKHCQALMFDLLGKARADEIAKETVGNPAISGWSNELVSGWGQPLWEPIYLHRQEPIRCGTTMGVAFGTAVLVLFSAGSPSKNGAIFRRWSNICDIWWFWRLIQSPLGGWSSIHFDSDSYGGASIVMGVTPVIIHLFVFFFHGISTIQLVGSPPFQDTPKVMMYGRL